MTGYKGGGLPRCQLRTSRVYMLSARLGFGVTEGCSQKEMIHTSNRADLIATALVLPARLVHVPNVRESQVATLNLRLGLAHRTFHTLTYRTAATD